MLRESFCHAAASHSRPRKAGAFSAQACSFYRVPFQFDSWVIFRLIFGLLINPIELAPRAESHCYYHHHNQRHNNNNGDNSISDNKSKNNKKINNNNNARDRDKGLTVVNGPRNTVAPPKTSLKKGRLGFIYYNMWNKRKSERSAKDGDSVRTGNSDARSYGG